MNTSFPRWLMALFVAVVLALVGAGIWFYQSQHQIARHSVEASLETIAQLKVDQIVQWRNERMADAAQLMESPFLTDAVVKWLEKPEPVQTADILARFRAASKHSHYRDVTLVDTNGQARLSLGGHRGPFRSAAAEALAIALRDRKPVLSELHVGPGDLPPHLEVIVPLVVSNADTVRSCGAILLQCDARKFLYPLVQSWPVPSASAETLLVRRAGNAALYLSRLRHQPKTALRLRVPLTKTNAVAVMAVLGQNGIVQGRDYRGVNSVSVIKAIPGSPWFLVAKVDAAEAFAAWHFRSVLILALIFGFIVTAAVIAGLVWQRTTKYYRYTRDLIEASLDPLVAINPELRILDANAATAKAIGRSRPELIGTDFAMYFTDPSRTRTNAEQAFRTGTARNLLLELCQHDGQVASVLCNVSVYRNEGGRKRCALAAIRDITERQRVDAALRRVHRAYRIISACNQALVRADDEFELLNEVCRLIVEDGGFCFAWVGFAEEDPARTVKPVAYTGHEAGYLSTVNISWGEEDHGRGPTGTAIRTGKAAVCRNTMTDPNFSPWRNEALKRGYASSLVLPLLDQDRVFGALSIYAAEVDAFTDEEVQLLTQLANDLAYGILSLRVRIKHQQAEDEIRKLNLELEGRVRERTRELAESEERFRAITTNTPDHLLVQDRDLRYTFVVNPQLGLTERDMLGKTDRDFLPPADADRLIRLKRSVLETGRPIHVEAPLTSPNGERRIFDGSYIPRLNGQGEVDGLIGYFRDVTERKRTEEEIRKLNEQLQQRAVLLEAANHELESFSYSVSHDLRAPLRAIDGFSQIVLEDCTAQLSAEGRENLERVRAATVRMGELIDDLLKLSRITRGEFHASRVNLSALAAAVADALRKMDEERAVDFVIAPGLAADGDAHLIRIVLENLLGNAWKFTTKRPAARIEFGAVPHEGASAYFVRDNGVGFDMTYASKLFGAFQRLHTTAEFPGTGIGLATVRRIIHRHGGRVWAESKPGQETTFYFTLPNQPRESKP